ncbi:hypothetical protein BJ742DRAFT_904780 [Cladochytrium replicatum]|nr:hypothetical protein BJ742DRAFT_904780 [Cladochytrium replicatum]
MPKEKRRSNRSKEQQNKGNIYNEEPEDIDKSSSTSSPLESERETQNNSRNCKRRKLNTSRRSLSSSALAVEGEGEADNQGSFTAAEPTSELGMAQDAARVGTDTRFSLSIHSYYKREKQMEGGVEVEYDVCIKCQQMKKMVRYKVISSSTTNQRGHLRARHSIDLDEIDKGLKKSKMTVAQMLQVQSGKHLISLELNEFTSLLTISAGVIQAKSSKQIAH